MRKLAAAFVMAVLTGGLAACSSPAPSAACENAVSGYDEVATQILQGLEENNPADLSIMSTLDRQQVSGLKQVQLLCPAGTKIISIPGSVNQGS